MSSATPETVSVPPMSSLNGYKTSVSYKPHRTGLKTSTTHPINISWILPEELIRGVSDGPLPASIDLYDIYTTTSLYKRYRKPTQSAGGRGGSECSSNEMGFGNLALSSCPGKKVRLSGPVRGRSAIDRDIDLDFQRLRSCGISLVVCCLNDEELAFLGAPWSIYADAARRYDLDIIRRPMIEGGCPDTVEQMDEVIKKMDTHIQQNERVLAHCRGGVGRAGLVACCWLLKRGYCYDANKAIRLVRMRRSPKAIETLMQEDFIRKYADYVQQKLKPTEGNAIYS
ncbi:4340_t:CDS:2 [Paraglomus brasilianum]|uniref:4340_t:CDS:1 n=1 Tax=Paraglomus brasilianum TaxID=144538 RepID=A0A9N9AQB1_9GLOM|nr:4340_t:CDS:2 [Paraglomus brasilianum]